jgi:diacylglycerol kinase family enzyme
MDICLIPETPNLGVITALPKLPFLGLRKLPGAIFRTTSTLEVKSSPPVSIHGDGDLLGQTPEAFRVLPKALRVMLPRETPTSLRVKSLANLLRA